LEYELRHERHKHSLGGNVNPDPIPADILKALSPFVSTDTTRPSMCHILRFAGYYWATDGHTSARFRFSDVTDTVRLLTADGGKSWIADGDGRCLYPSIEQVWAPPLSPLRKPTGPWSFDPIYLARLVEIEKCIVRCMQAAIKAESRYQDKLTKYLKKELQDRLRGCARDACHIMFLGGELDPVLFDYGPCRWQVLIMPRKA